MHYLQLNSGWWDKSVYSWISGSVIDNHLYSLPVHRLHATSLRALRRIGEAEQQVSDMATEGADMTEETEYMIDKNVGKETCENVETSSDAKEMRAVILAGFGGLNKLRVTKKAMPELQDGEVKIRVKAW